MTIISLDGSLPRIYGGGLAVYASFDQQQKSFVLGFTFVGNEFRVIESAGNLG